MMPRTRRCLIISDSRFGSVEPSPLEDWEVQLWSVPGLELEELLNLANKKMKRKTDLVILVGLLCDLTYRVDRPLDSSTERGLCRSHRKLHLDPLINKIMAFSRHWEEFRDLSIVWTLPHEIDFVKYNRKLLRKCYDEDDFTQSQFEDALADGLAFEEQFCTIFPI